MSKYLKVSLIISTYNWPEALALCLKSVAKQSILPMEVIIADDGSRAATKEMIESFQNRFPVPVIHVWQSDEGFQLSKIRNKAIAASSGEYIVQIDGDLILHPQFIRDHINFCKKSSFVTGSRVMLGKKLSHELLTSQSTNVSIFNNDISNRTNGIRNLILRNILADRYRINDLYFMRGCNMAFWRADLVMVNGYNEEFIGWGREDNEIAVRLMNLGFKKRVIKFGAVVFHLHHTVNIRTGLNINDQLLKDAVSSRSVYCPKGLNQYL